MRQQEQQPSEPPTQMPAPAAAPPHIDLASIGPLRVAVVEVLPEEGAGNGQEGGGARSGSGGPEGTPVSVLLQVTALRSTPTNVAGLSSVTGWPIRSAPAPTLSCPDGMLVSQELSVIGCTCSRNCIGCHACMLAWEEPMR